MKTISPQALKPLLTDGNEIAFLDVREHGQYGEGHPFFSVHLQFSKMESLTPRLMPSKSVRCVVMDDGDDIGPRAAAVLEGLGYTNVMVLIGGAPAWAAAGYTLFKGVNVPSKSFGELVEHQLGTKSVTADELHSMQNSGEDVIILDGRTRKEFFKMSLPGAQSCPNAELGYRVSSLIKDPTTKIVINCAGRTRSIIGAETLTMMDLPNPVMALKNGTQGWRIAGYELDHGNEAGELPSPNAEQQELGQIKGQTLRAKFGISMINAEEAQIWLEDLSQTTYLFDVRTRSEYDAGHVIGARNAPGGQLVQATDEQLAVRNARIVLSCDNGLRSSSMAVWLKGMGHRVWILDPETPMAETEDATPAPVRVKQTVNLDEMKALVDAGAKVLDASPGMGFRDGHIKGATWVTRARIDFDALQNPEDWVLTGSCRMLLAGINADIEAATGRSFKGVAQGTSETWRSAGFTIEKTENTPSEEDCIDYLFFVHDRHDGNLEAARRYLEWELGLLEQLDAQERGELAPLMPSE